MNEVHTIEAATTQRSSLTATEASCSRTELQRRTRTPYRQQGLPTVRTIAVTPPLLARGTVSSRTLVSREYLQSKRQAATKS